MSGSLCFITNIRYNYKADIQIERNNKERCDMQGSRYPFMGCALLQGHGKWTRPIDINQCVASK